MITLLKRLFERLLSSPRKANASVEDKDGDSKSMPMENNLSQVDEAVIHETLMAFDEGLLDNARTYWKVGDWKILSEIDQDQLQHHPDRAKLALLVAMGHQQIGNAVLAKELILLSARWGCNKTLIAKVLVAGVHRNLGQATVMTGHADAEIRAIKHFTTAASLSAVSGTSTSFSLPNLYLQAAQIKLIQQADLPPSE